MTTISAGRFSGERPVCFARGRHGDLFAVQGHGVRPMRWDGVSPYSEDAGMDAPAFAPTVSTTGATQYYVVRVDVQSSGSGYYQPPQVTFNGTLAAGGRAAVARAYLQNAGINDVRLDDSGRGYTSPPSASLSGTYASGAAGYATVVNGAVTAVTITSGGSGYLVAPTVSIEGGGGAGAAATATVANGQVTGISLLSSGGGYTGTPTVSFSSGGAELFPLSRPHLRGKYECYYRYVDDTPEDRGGPIPSNLSPVAQIDCGEGAGALLWANTASNVRGRTHRVELWRTTSNQATTLYRVATIVPGETHTDSLTDPELRDPERAGYAAMPVLLPNGELNANRFGIPPADKSTVVSFQDRFWFAVDTSGTEPNTMYFSESDEPESVPDVNEIIVQENVRDTDAITALVPFGAALLVMQSRHCYRFTFARQPIIDAGINLMAYRGCLNQRCWDLHDGVAYVMDQFGVYSVSQNGDISPISEGIANYFQQMVDYTYADWFSVRFDPKLRVLRVFLSIKGDRPSDKPCRALCYSPVMQAWWEERYPSPITAASGITLASGEYRVLYASSRQTVYALDEGKVDVGDGSVLSVSITERGAGYIHPPYVQPRGGHGAWMEATVEKGRVQSILVRVPGFGYAPGDEIDLSPPDDEAHPHPVQATAVVNEVATSTSLATPYIFKSSAFEYALDGQVAGKDKRDRSVSVTYRPTECDSILKLRMFYNDSRVPRANVSPRDRGIGFKHDAAEPVATKNMRRQTVARGESAGVDIARFAHQSSAEIAGTDRHVAVELSGERGATGEVVIHQIDVQGVVE